MYFYGIRTFNTQKPSNTRLFFELSKKNISKLSAIYKLVTIYCPIIWAKIFLAFILFLICFILIFIYFIYFIIFLYIVSIFLFHCTTALLETKESSLKNKHNIPSLQNYLQRSTCDDVNHQWDYAEGRHLTGSCVYSQIDKMHIFSLCSFFPTGNLKN